MTRRARANTAEAVREDVIPEFESPLVSTQWLGAHLDAADVKIVDASWYLPSAGRDAALEYVEGHIPGAVFFDIDAVANTESALPHMTAHPDRFSAIAGALGISNTDRIVVYDGAGLMSAARAWWNFRIMGARSVYVLNGGLPLWKAEERPIEAGVERPETAVFEADPDLENVVTADEIVAQLESEDRPQVIDARATERFSGKVGEPRPGLRRGHIPHSINLPFHHLLRDGELLPQDELQSRFKAAGIDPKKPVITTCGSGVTAPILNLALSVAGYEHMRVYDGSWAEWGGREDLPIEGGVSAEDGE